MYSSSYEPVEDEERRVRVEGREVLIEEDMESVDRFFPPESLCLRTFSPPSQILPRLSTALPINHLLPPPIQITKIRCTSTVI
jgi:hypothetical protein